MAERRATQKNLDRVNALYERKLAMITDVLDLKARVDALAAQEVEARNQVRLSREDLSELVGRAVVEKLSRIREDVALQVPGESLDVWITRAVAANPALKARESALAAAEAAVREGKGGHYPQPTSRRNPALTGYVPHVMRSNLQKSPVRPRKKGFSTA